MEASKKVDEYRKKLDKSLLAHNLVDEDALRTLVKDRILCSREGGQEGSVEKLVQKRTTELLNLLDMLRSESEKYVRSPCQPYASWKVKQDNEKFRSMYREGPSGTPVHTFFVDGYVDAPLDSCMFPESRFHKVTVDYFKKIGHGEQLSLLRLKLAWPLSDREILLHHSVLEHYEDDLVVLLMNSEEFCKETDGFTNDEIPKPTKALRIDLFGGIVFQKVSETKTFLRLILNADLKINFVPQAVVNFITGKLLGTAFKLYDKWVTKISQEEGNGSRIMENPICERIRDALYPNRSPNKAMGTDVSSHDDFCPSYPSDYDDETSSLYESVIGWDDNCSGFDEEDDTKGVDAATATAENDTRKKKDQLRVREPAEPGYLNKNSVEPSPLVGLAIGTQEEAVSPISDGSPVLKMNGSIPVILINMKNLRPIPTASDMSRTWQDLPHRNFVYTQGDLVTSYIIKDGMLMRSEPSKAIHQNQQQIFVVDAKDACDGKNDERKRPRKLRNWALPCIYSPDVSQ
ncbi:hypothetical protein AKJ16_DCAP19494 [Drosera capensis]